MEAILRTIARNWTDDTREEIRDVAKVIGENVDLSQAGEESIKAALKNMSLEFANYSPYAKFTSKSGESSQYCPLLSKDAFELSLIKVPGTLELPQHFENGALIVEVISCGDDAKIGPTSDHVQTISAGSRFRFPSTAPKVIRSGSSTSLLLLVCRTFIVDGGESTEFSDLGSGIEYEGDIMHIGDIHSYYLNFAKDYEKVMRGWGYCLPEPTADAVIKHCNFEADFTKIRVLDLGCGDGLTGLALHRRGFRRLTAVDNSPPMLAKAAERSLYDTLQQVDLLGKLPFENDSFDCLVSTAVTTYLKPYVLEDWIRVARKYLVFTHKTAIWAEWEAEQTRLEQLGLWKLVWESPEPVLYLPSLREGGKDSESCDQRAKIYIYAKI